MPEQIFWVLVVIAGPVILGIVFVYALLRNRRLSQHERAMQHEAVNDAYRDEDPRRS